MSEHWIAWHPEKVKAFQSYSADAVKRELKAWVQMEFNATPRWPTLAREGWRVTKVEDRDE